MKRLHNSISRKFSFTTSAPLWVFIPMPFIAYLAWEYYWFTRVGYHCIKWHTHMMAYVYLWIVGFGIIWLIAGRQVSENGKKALLAFSSVVIILSAFEIYFIITGSKKTYLEKITGDYVSPYAPTNQSHYHSWPPNEAHWIKKPEYLYWRPTNSLGLPDIEWTFTKKPGEIRVLALGDSFTEGDGAPYDSSYVALLSKKCMIAGDTFYFMNAGVCGSDPFFNFIFLKNRLLEYKPDIVIQTLSTFDLTSDIMTRGGMERFQDDGTLKFRAAPWWEPLYAMNYVSRIFFSMAGYNEWLKREKISSNEEQMLNCQIVGLLKEYSLLCRQNGIRLIILLHPDRHEIEYNRYDHDFSIIVREINSDTLAEVIDLLPSFRDYIARNQTKLADYFWAHDGHHNSRGYEMMAHSLYENLHLPLAKQDKDVN